jgi:hypothetical protein
MKYPILFIAWSFWITCTKDNLQADQSFDRTYLEERGRKVKINLCHINENGDFQALSVPQNAVQAHLDHGDYLADADGDGYSAVGACSGSGDDCDDEDPDTNPGSGACTGCVCSDLDELNESNLLFYFNSDNNPCHIYNDPTGVILFFAASGDTMVALAGIEEDGQIIVGLGEVQNGVIQESEHGCKQVVGMDITLEQYETCLAGLRAIIAGHPALPNVCDIDMPPVFIDTNPE